MPPKNSGPEQCYKKDAPLADVVDVWFRGAGGDVITPFVSNLTRLNKKKCQNQNE